MRILASLFVFAFIGTAVNPAIAQTTEGAAVFIYGGLTTTDVMGDEPDNLTFSPPSSQDFEVESLHDKSLDTGLGIRVVKYIAIEGGWSKRHLNQGVLNVPDTPVIPSFFPNSPDSSLTQTMPEVRYQTSMSTGWLGGRAIAPVAPRADLYAGLLAGRYWMRTNVRFNGESNNAESTGTAFRFKGGLLVEIVRHVHFGVEVQHTKYCNVATEMSGGVNVTFAF